MYNHTNNYTLWKIKLCVTIQTYYDPFKSLLLEIQYQVIQKSKLKTATSKMYLKYLMPNSFLVIITVIYTLLITTLLTVEIKINKKSIGKCGQHANEKHCCLK